MDPCQWLSRESWLRFYLRSLPTWTILWFSDWLFLWVLSNNNETSPFSGVARFLCIQTNQRPEQNGCYQLYWCYRGWSHILPVDPTPWFLKLAQLGKTLQALRALTEHLILSKGTLSCLFLKLQLMALSMLGLYLYCLISDLAHLNKSLTRIFRSLTQVPQ